jgi:hypothetical protein
MEKNAYISIWGFLVFVVDSSLDVYEKWETFQRHGIARKETLGERKEIFIETLIHNGLVNEVSDAEVIPDKIDSYFDWFFMKADPKAELVPSPDCLLRLQQAIGDKEFNAMSVYERELFATGYRSPLITDVNFDRQTYFRWVGDHKAGSFETKKMALFKSWFKRNQDMATAEQGFAVQNVFSNDPKDKWASYSYTYGAQGKLGYEVLIVNAGQNSGAMLAKVTKWAIETGGFIENVPFTIPGYTVGPAGELLKAVATEQIMGDVATTRMLGAVNAGMTRYMQVFVGDKNNILPGEDGYDTGYVQELPPEVSDEQGH